VRGFAYARHKNWQVLFAAFAFSCLESYREFSPLKRVMISRDWVRIANRLVSWSGDDYAKMFKQFCIDLWTR